ncbi:MAG: DMT family transporter [Microcystis aeruginosa W13-18]|jgi:uncharacterized membrane protein|nr:DMT family transporter [Microcystis aeruginosa W13-18]NCR37030.1 DMT family transporter [Microcystis aeruginosa S11-05]NCR50561.1 DMT family transporter [Microcystis aeruginosa S11-01]
MSWLYFSFAAAFFESLRDVFSKIITNKGNQPLDEYLVAWSLRAFTLIIYLPWLLLSPHPIPTIGQDFWWALLADATLSTIGGILYMRALRYGDLSLTVPLMGFSPLFLVMASPVLLHEFPSKAQFLGILLVCLGAYCLNLNHGERNYLAPLKSLITNQPSRLMIIVAFLWALTTSFDKIGAKNSSPLFFSASLYFCTALISFPIVVIFSPNWLSKLKANFAKLTLLASLKALDMWFHVMAIASTVAANSVAVKQSSLLMSVGYGYFLFHEKNVKQRLFGCIIILAGVSLLSIL